MAVKWSITHLDYELSKDGKSYVVTDVYWDASDSKEVTKDGKKVIYKASQHDSIRIDSDKTESKDPWKDNSFIEYSKLDESTVLGWVKSKMGDDKVKSIEDEIASKIDIQVNPTSGEGKPW